MNTEAKLFTEIDELMREFTPLARQVVRQNIQKRGVTVSGDLEKSIDTRIQAASGKLKTAFILSFAHYGKAMESKRRYSHNASIEVLKEWILQKGLQHFDFVPNYNADLPPLDDAARRIAYGIYLANKQGGSSFRKTYKGYLIYRPFFGLWREFRKEIAARFAGVVSRDIFKEYVDNLKKNTKDGHVHFK